MRRFLNADAPMDITSRWLTARIHARYNQRRLEARAELCLVALEHLSRDVASMKQGRWDSLEHIDACSPMAHRIMGTRQVSSFTPLATLTISRTNKRFEVDADVRARFAPRICADAVSCGSWFARRTLSSAITMLSTPDGGQPRHPRTWHGGAVHAFQCMHQDLPGSR